MQRDSDSESAGKVNGRQEEHLRRGNSLTKKRSQHDACLQREADQVTHGSVEYWSGERYGTQL